MHPIAEQLLEQHLAFELEALTDKRVQPFLRSAVQRWFELAAEQTLSELVTEKRCRAAARRLLAQSRIPPSAWDFGVSLLLRFNDHLGDSKAEVRTLLGEGQFVELVQGLANLNEPRRRLLAEAFNHPLYSELISSLVYEALLNYLVQDNLISQKVPGVGSMLKLGRKVATKAVPGLDATVERQLKNYIKSCLPSLIKTSEQFVDELLTGDELEDRVKKAWPEVGSLPLAAMTEDLRVEDVERLGAWGRDSWDELRRSDWFMDTAEILIAHCYERYGDEPLAVLLDDFGIRRGMVSKEVITFVPPLLKQLREAGFLGELLRLRLTPFYESKAVTKILTAAGKGAV